MSVKYVATRFDQLTKTKTSSMFDKDKDRLEERKIAVLGPVLIFSRKVEVKDSEAR